MLRTRAALQTNQRGRIYVNELAHMHQRMITTPSHAGHKRGEIETDAESLAVALYGRSHEDEDRM